MGPSPASPSSPDRIVLLGRDGTVLREEGASSERPPALDCPELATSLRRLARRAIRERCAAELSLVLDGARFELKVSALGPDRAVCVIRELPPARQTGPGHDWSDRAEFIRGLQEAIDQARLREVGLSVAIIELDGLAEVARLIDAELAQQVLNAALGRALVAEASESDGSIAGGVLGATTLALVMPKQSRAVSEKRIERLLEALREPVAIGDAVFHLAPYAGVADLGRDSAAPSSLLAQARHAAADAMAANSRGVRFASSARAGTRSAVSDVARELHAAIGAGAVGLRYVPRHDLATGRRVAWVGYLRWQHPLRGEIAAAECLSIAESTGLSKSLSRALLASVARDFATLLSGDSQDVRLSLGALRHHVLDDVFAEDIAELTSSGGIPAERLELRISERTFAATDMDTLHTLADMGVQLIVDEVGRALLPLDRLARAPLFGLQLDRAWVVGSVGQGMARRICEAGVGVARALGLIPIANGIDEEAQREMLLALGCQHGAGDLFTGAARTQHKQAAPAAPTERPQIM